jgi:PTS system nitrogen regulatory IIA component
MNFYELVQPDSVLCNVSARSKKHCLEILSELLTRSNPDISNEEVFAKLIGRERLGCTSLDKGVAFPHCRINGLRKSAAALMSLTAPVDFDSSDGHPVDLIFGLMVPEELDENDIAEIETLTGLLRNEALLARLRAATSSKELGEALLVDQTEPAATFLSARQG